MSSTPSKQTGNKKPATPAPAGLAGSASVTPAPTAVGSASASLAGVVAEDKQQPKKSGLADGVYMSVAIPVLYFSAALFSVYLFKSGLATTYVLPYFSALGLKKAVIPWAAFFAEFVIAYIAGTLSIIAFSFMGLYDNNHPRTKKLHAVSFAGRLHAAHENAYENLVIFGAALIIAHLEKVPIDVRITLSLIHVTTRLVYVFLYACNIDVLRSFAHAVSIGTVVQLFLYVLLSDPAVQLDQFYYTFTGSLWQLFAPIVHQFA